MVSANETDRLVHEWITWPDSRLRTLCIWVCEKVSNGTVGQFSDTEWNNICKDKYFWVEINAKVELCLNKQMMSIYMNSSKKPTQFRLSTKPTNIYKYQLKLLSSRHSQPALISISRYFPWNLLLRECRWWEWFEQVLGGAVPIARGPDDGSAWKAPTAPLLLS